MKRGLCCLCAVLVCAAVATADMPDKFQVHQSPAGPVTKVSSTETQTDTPILAGPSQLIESEFNLAITQLSNRAPVGFTSPKTSATFGARIDCPPGATIDPEPFCSDEYDDVTNGGCNSTPARCSGRSLVARPFAARAVRSCTAAATIARWTGSRPPSSPTPK